MKHEETYGEMGETYRELPLGGFLSNLVTSFQAASYIAGLTHERLPSMPYNQINRQQSIFPWFSPTHGVLCKIYFRGGW